MKRVLLLLFALVLIVPGVALAQADTLSRSEINRISNSVVLIVNLDSSGSPTVSGSGTIVAPSGLIYTNRHVVEGGADFAILTLDQLGEPAKLAYFASATMIHPDVDFAELQIDRDANGNAVNSDGLNLPYIALTNTQPDIGDRIFVFGYPDLGDAHLVMTSGSITTIQNDTLNGERIPFWYQTDAQISPGNSGGLVVNLSGRMIGIPTQVVSEERTLGRLGGILSITAIRGALESAPSSLPPIVATPGSQITAPTPAVSNPPNTQGSQSITVSITNVEQNATNNDALGMMVHTSIEAIGYKNVPLRAAVFTYWQDGSPITANSRASADSRSTSGQLTVQQVLSPGYDDTVWDNSWFFIPYNYLPDGRTGTYPAFIEAQVGVDGQGFTDFSNDVAFDYTYPDQQLIIDVTNIEQNVQLNNLTGMKVHTHIKTLNYQGQLLWVGIFPFWADDTEVVGGDSAPVENTTTSGYLTVQDNVTPSYNNSEWNDFWFFLPYQYFPSGLHGTQDGYIEADIGVEGGESTSWSLPYGFTLNFN